MLKAEEVKEVFFDCLYKDGEDFSNPAPVEVHGVGMHIGFHPRRLEENKHKISAFLNELPDSFNLSTGGGHSFLAACTDKAGNQWGGHSDIDHLVCMGLAIGAVEFKLPRNMWNILPGGMPYFSVKDIVNNS